MLKILKIPFFSLTRFKWTKTHLAEQSWLFESLINQFKGDKLQKRKENMSKNAKT